MIGKHAYAAITLLLLGGSLYAQARTDCVVVPKSLAEMHDCYRPLLVFSPTGQDPRLRRQAALLDAAADDMMDRFVLYTPIVARGGPVTTPVDAPYTVLSAQEMSVARSRFHIGTSDFVVLLLDEDGKPKLRNSAPVNADRLNALIDRMPRRQAEMRRRDAN